MEKKNYSQVGAHYSLFMVKGTFSGLNSILIGLIIFANRSRTVVV